VNIFKDRQCKVLVCRSSGGHFCRTALEPACTRCGWTAWGQGCRLSASWWSTLSRISWRLTLPCGSWCWGPGDKIAGVCWCRFAWGHSCSGELACEELQWWPGQGSSGWEPGSGGLPAGVLSSCGHGSTRGHRWWSTRSRRLKSTQAWKIAHKFPAILLCRSQQVLVSPLRGTPRRMWSLPAVRTGTHRLYCIHCGRFESILFCNEWNSLHLHRYYHFHHYFPFYLLALLAPCRSSSGHRRQRRWGRNKAGKEEELPAGIR